MKLYIFDQQNCEQPWWFAFRKSIPTDAWPITELKNMYNAKLVSNYDYTGTYIEFPDDKQAMWFKIRYGV